MPEAVIERELEQGADRLERAGLANAKREARALWAAVAGVTPGDVWLARDAEAPEPLAARFRDSVERRASGVPFAYTVGRVSFRRLDLKLDPRALIPRPETEGLVDLVLDWCRSQRATRNWGLGAGDWGLGGVAADIGTGCGCIALALATEGSFDRVVAVERSPEAAALARENVELVAPAVPVEVREGDLLGPLAGDRCRVIVSNPPYLTEQEYAELDPSVRVFEPREALVSGTDGLEATRALLATARSLLEPDGVLALEIDERRAAQVQELAQAHGWQPTIHRDLFGRERYLLAEAL